ncbi:MAG: type II toxin-antitoxin system HicB family antitoxin [Planctomycetota bacterium]
MTNTYTAILKKADDWWIGWVEEVPGVNCQERTREELLKSIKEALETIIELNREASRRDAGDSAETAEITVAA